MGLVEPRRPVVLVVEDEYLLRLNAADMIRAADFQVIEAASADEAIAILESRDDIAVVFTDIQMPGSMDGLKLARTVRGAGRRSRLSRPPATSGLRQPICPSAEDF